MSRRLIGISLVMALLGLMITSNACSNDKLPEPMPPECGTDPIIYDNQIEPIITASCALIGCHDGSGAAPGDFTTYASTLSRLDNGKIKERVIDKMDMPVAPITITTAEFDLIKCWLEAGHPEK